jgi:CheY-like chemotaxis protein
MPSILFLDDDAARHSLFRARIEELGHAARYRMLYVYTAAEAIAALDAHGAEIVHAFLDHDLSEADILVAVGAPSQVPTGMAVVDHILRMAAPPAAVVVHSYNRDAALEMCARLTTLGTVRVQRLPFSDLLFKLDDRQVLA